jgi:hypothetical protein
MSSTSSTVANVPRISATRCFLQATFKCQMDCLRELGQPLKSPQLQFGVQKGYYVHKYVISVAVPEDVA